MVVSAEAVCLLRLASLFRSALRDESLAHVRGRVTAIASRTFRRLRSAAGKYFLEVAMPYYEYLCQGCKKKFSMPLTIAEHDKGRVKCPKCGSSKLEQQWAAFYATTSKKS
jgi:putative FmdB family regulatory protein